MKKTLLITPLFFLSCFGDQARKNLEAENLVLNECEYVMRVLNMKLDNPIPDSRFVRTCGCISEILREKLVGTHDINTLKRDARLRKEILEKELEGHLKRIRKECLPAPR